jgi:AbiTii
VTTPLILQIRDAALDSRCSVTDALRKAKVACAKLGLDEFGKWIDLELNGYFDKSLDETPKYRLLHGKPEGHNPFHGWQQIVFMDAEEEEVLSQASIGTPISAIEDSVRDAKGSDSFSSPYNARLQQMLRRNLNVADVNLRIKLSHHQTAAIVHAVRNILLEWTIDMEKQGILGEDLTFSAEDRQKSASVTAQVVNHFNIGQVASLVQNADHSVVQGSIGSPMVSPQSTLELVDHITALLATAKLTAPIESDARAALEELKHAATATKPEIGRIKKGLESLKRILGSAGESFIKVAADAAITRMLGPS